MSRSTGPILAAGGITWANNVLLNGDAEDDIFTSSARISIATGIAAMMLYGIEVLFGDLATALSWAALTTVLFVRVGNNPTPMERALALF